jgi:hypothetical protein
MAIQVTGLFQNPQTNLIYESPLLTMVPQLLYANQIGLVINIGTMGSINYGSVDKDTLTYDPAITDAYMQLIDALDTYAIDVLKDANPINRSSIFTKA